MISRFRTFIAQEHEPDLVFLWRRGGAAVLGLLPMPKPIMIGDQPYHVC